MESPAAHPARRSRLTPEREGELYAGTLDLVREVGYEAITLDAIAARSRCSKATLYRQWQGKPRLVAAALLHSRPFSLEGLDTGSLRGDLYELAERIGGAQKDLDLLRGIAHAVHTNEDLADALHSALVRPMLDALGEMLERAVARGEVAADNPATGYLPYVFNGAALVRPIIARREPDAPFLKEYLEAVVLPLLLRS